MIKFCATVLVIIGLCMFFTGVFGMLFTQYGIALILAHFGVWVIEKAGPHVYQWMKPEKPAPPAPPPEPVKPKMIRGLHNWFAPRPHHTLVFTRKSKWVR